MKRDIYKQVTDQIIEALENGVRPWQQPWQTTGATIPLRHCGTPYTGMNTILLWCAAIDNGFSSSFWMTYRQAQKLNGQVRKGF
jgi:antirestriction protein ArdC